MGVTVLFYKLFQFNRHTGTLLLPWQRNLQIHTLPELGS